MNKSYCVAAAAACLLGLGLRAEAQDAPVVEPTAEHKRLAEDVGVWDAEVKLWAQGPGAEPTVSKGVEEISVMPGGLWQLGKFEGKIGDKEFVGRSVTGYDVHKKKYVGVWVDSTDPHMMLTEGEYDEATHTETATAKGTDPASGKPYDLKMTTLHKGKDARVFTMNMKIAEAGDEFFKLMEISYTRRAK
ncbi:MAG: DUF1579 domain-containing protein [Paludisphaera borealis]|uniref:DUF1579 domain-containing protein n=1 Tax=Paludisphaera borealis TaxID=1387353 RepID=UPI00284491D6|nr:DUF1579 domain-containing protein [Paludisphaera borealis]MDR3623232.1 DUF1579 domain-containing protein [Paludisphaera borealis]